MPRVGEGKGQLEEHHPQWGEGVLRQLKAGAMTVYREVRVRNILKLNQEIIFVFRSSEFSHPRDYKFSVSYLET